jgi:hypothetical protein
MLESGATAINAGIAGAPTVDILGVTRGSLITLRELIPTRFETGKSLR